jgi:transcriptional regulator with XRE-family HTH domain
MRHKREWTLLDLTLKTAIGQSELSKYENGRTVPKLDAMLKITEAFGEAPSLLELNARWSQMGLDLGEEDLSPQDEGSETFAAVG